MNQWSGNAGAGAVARPPPVSRSPARPVATAVIAASMLTQRSSNPRLQLDELKVAAHQFQSAVGSELLVTELDRKLLLDRLPQPPYLQPHLWGLRVVPSGVAAALQMTRRMSLFFDQFVES